MIGKAGSRRWLRRLPVVCIYDKGVNHDDAETLFLWSHRIGNVLKVELIVLVLHSLLCVDKLFHYPWVIFLLFSDVWRAKWLDLVRFEMTFALFKCC